MDSRERTFAALSFTQPDRVPIDFWASRGCRARLQSATGHDWDTFLDAQDVDIRYIEGPRYVGPPLAYDADGVGEDIWGVRRKTVQVGSNGGAEHYKEVVFSPLAAAQSREAVETYGHWPAPDWFDYSEIAAQCEAIRARGRIAAFMGDRLNRIAQLKPAMYLRGTEQIFLDLALNPELAHALFARIRAFYLEYARRVFEAACGKLDLVVTGDDFGAQTGPLLSPRMWEEFLGEGFAAYIALAHEHDLPVMHHTCGSVRKLLPCLLDRGLDILQSLQPEAAAMDAGELKHEYGGALAFQGGISIQRTLPFGTPTDVREEVRDTLAALMPGGGYIACTAHNIQADTPPENVNALLAAYREFGRYA